MKNKKEDLGVKMGTPEEVFWTNVKDKAEAMIKQCKYETIIQEHILKLTKSKIKEEQAK